MFHVRSVSTGVAGSPYYTNLYFNGDPGNVNIALARVRQFWVDLAGVVRSGIVTNVESEVRVIDPSNGNVTNILVGAEQAAVAASAGGTVAPTATQGLIRLQTSGLRFNRQVQGRIFIPGVTQTAVSAQGTALSGYQNTLTTAATALRATTSGVQLVVWSRPRTLTGPIELFGQASPVTGASAWQDFAVLRSRRD